MSPRVSQLSRSLLVLLVVVDATSVVVASISSLPRSLALLRCSARFCHRRRRSSAHRRLLCCCGAHIVCTQLITALHSPAHCLFHQVTNTSSPCPARPLRAHSLPACRPSSQPHPLPPSSASTAYPLPSSPTSRSSCRCPTSCCTSRTSATPSLQSRRSRSPATRWRGRPRCSSS